MVRERDKFVEHEHVTTVIFLGTYRVHFCRVFTSLYMKYVTCKRRPSKAETDAMPPVIVQTSK